MKKKILTYFLAMVIVVTAVSVPALAASSQAKTVKMSVYNDVLKSGDTVYCAGYKGLYKVKLKKDKVKSVKLIVKEPNDATCHMRKNGKYLYYVFDCYQVVEFWGVNTSNGESESLGGGSSEDYWYFVDGDWDYVIKDNRIYCTWDDINYDNSGNEYTVKRKQVMKMDGSKKKKTSVKAVMKEKKSNAKGYSLKIKKTKKYYKDYLKTPKGTFYLGKAEKH